MKFFIITTLIATILTPTIAFIPTKSIRSADIVTGGLGLTPKTSLSAYELVLLRHGESTWNEENRFTGWADVPLSTKGLGEARAGGQLMKAEGMKVRTEGSVWQRSVEDKRSEAVDDRYYCIKDNVLPIHPISL